MSAIQKDFKSFSFLLFNSTVTVDFLHRTEETESRVTSLKGLHGFHSPGQECRSTMQTKPRVEAGDDFDARRPLPVIFVSGFVLV